MIIVFGLIASGKSTLAAALASRRGLALLSADYTRKELAGLPLYEPQRDATFRGFYGDAASQRVYDELMERASELLRSGRSVVIDASFRSRAQRDAARELAAARGCDASFLQCVCPREAALERLDQRATAPSLSDGRAEIYDAFAEHYEPPVALGPEHCIRVDTTRPLRASLEQALAALA